MSPPLSRRAFGLALVVSATAVACSSRSSATPTMIVPKVLPTATASPVAGHLLLVHGGNFFDFDLATMRQTQLTHYGQNEFATTPTLSPDRARLAYTYYAIPSDPKDLGGSDLYISNADTSAPRLVRPHPQPGVSFEEPAWLANGEAIAATLREPPPTNGQNATDVVNLYRIGLSDGQMTRLVPNAQSAILSADGKYLAYLTRDASGQPNALWIASPDGSGARQVAADAKFSLVRAPRFAPDGSRLAFAAVGGPPATSHAQGSWFAGVAEAHGIPWEIWTVQPNGSDLRRLTDEQEDSPTPAWSPDNRWIAFAGEIGTYLVDAQGARTICLTTTISAGGLVWLK